MAKLQKTTTFGIAYRCIEGLTRGRAFRIARTLGATQRTRQTYSEESWECLSPDKQRVYARIYKGWDGRWTIHYIFRNIINNKWGNRRGR